MPTLSDRYWMADGDSTLIFLYFLNYVILLFKYITHLSLATKDDKIKRCFFGWGKERERERERSERALDKAFFVGRRRRGYNKVNYKRLTNLLFMTRLYHFRKLSFDSRN